MLNIGRQADIGITMDGDLALSSEIIGSDGDVVKDDKDRNARDLTVSSGVQFLVQTVYTRIKTQSPDWTSYPHLGANLKDYIGEPNSRQTAEDMINTIEYTLTYDNLVDEDSLDIEVIPANRDEVAIFIRIEVGLRGPIVIPVQFSFTRGVIGGDDLL